VASPPFSRGVGRLSIERRVKQDGKDAKGLVLKFQADAVLMEFARTEIHTEGIEPNHVGLS
jgi:hypothetical protein